MKTINDLLWLWSVIFIYSQLHLGYHYMQFMGTRINAKNSKLEDIKNDVKKLTGTFAKNIPPQLKVTVAIGIISLLLSIIAIVYGWMM